MQIVMYDSYGNTIQRINLYEAFPSSLREVALAWGQGDLIRISVSVTYSSFTIVSSELEGYLSNEISSTASELLRRINI
jgi:hypothetical protein